MFCMDARSALAAKVVYANEDKNINNSKNILTGDRIGLNVHIVLK